MCKKILIAVLLLMCFYASPAAADPRCPDGFLTQGTGTDGVPGDRLWFGKSNVNFNRNETKTYCAVVPPGSFTRAKFAVNDTSNRTCARISIKVTHLPTGKVVDSGSPSIGPEVRFSPGQGGGYIVEVSDHGSSRTAPDICHFFNIAFNWTGARSSVDTPASVLPVTIPPNPVPSAMCSPGIEAFVDGHFLGAGCPSGYEVMNCGVGLPPQTDEEGHVRASPALELDTRKLCVVLDQDVNYLRFAADDVSAACGIVINVTPPPPLAPQTGTGGLAVSYGSLAGFGFDPAVYAPAGAYLIDASITNTSQFCIDTLNGLFPNKTQIDAYYKYYPSTPPGSTLPPVVPPPPIPPVPPVPVTGPGMLQGCATEQYEAQKAYNEAQAAHDSAVNEEMTEKPDSKQILSCLDKGMQESAKAGNIFSDVLISNVASTTTTATSGLLGTSNILTGIIPGVGPVPMDKLGNALGYVVAPALVNFSGNFLGSLGQLLGPTIGGTLGGFFNSLLGFGGNVLNMIFSFFGGGGSFECTSMSDLWSYLIVSGLNPEVNHLKFQDWLNGKIPNSFGDTFIKNMKADQKVREDAVKALTKIRPGTVPYFPKAPVFTGNESVGHMSGVGWHP